MQSLFKVFTILPPHQLRKCVIIIAAMVVGAILEAIGIGAILPLISLMGNPDFLTAYPKVSQYAEFVDITTHSQFIMAATILLLILYYKKHLFSVAK